MNKLNVEIIDKDSEDIFGAFGVDAKELVKRVERITSVFRDVDLESMRDDLPKSKEALIVKTMIDSCETPAEMAVLCFLAGKNVALVSLKNTVDEVMEMFKNKGKES